MATLGLRGHDVSLAQVTGVYNINNYIVLGENFRGSAGLQELLESSEVLLRTRNLSRQWWWARTLSEHILSCGLSCRSLARDKGVTDTYIVMGPRQIPRSGANYELTRNWA